MIVAEIVAATNAAGATTTFYVSDNRFVTGSGDTPAHTFFNPSILDPGNIGLNAFSDGVTAGSTKLEIGDLILVNTNGQYDDWINYSFDGRSIIIRSGTAGSAYPAGFSTVFTGTIESITASWDRIIIRLRDKQFMFSTPLLTTKYAGTNSLPNGLEGTPNDIKGNVKPRVYGKVFNVTPAFINTSKLTYQVSDIAVNSISAVYDRGAALTPGADYANSTLLQAASPSASTYITCLAEGMFRLGSTPSGIITADVTQGAAASNRTAAQIVKLIALAAGLPSGEINSTDVTNMDTANSSVVGIYVDSESSFQECMDEVLNSVGAYAGFDSTGVLRMGVLTAPSGTAVTVLEEFDLKGVPERRSPKDNGIPIYRSTINHTKIYTVQSSDVAGVVSTASRAYLEKEYRSVVSEDTSIKTQYLLAKESIQNTLLTTEANASTEATRRLALYKVKRDLYEVVVDLSLFTQYSLKLLDVVEMNVNRFSLPTKKFRIIGYRLEIKDQSVRLSLWG